MSAILVCILGVLTGIGSQIYVKLKYDYWFDFDIYSILLLLISGVDDFFTLVSKPETFTGYREELMNTLPPYISSWVGLQKTLDGVFDLWFPFYVGLVLIPLIIKFWGWADDLERKG